jgi:glycosyltransferase involved in cell wall biosynthesis
MHQILYVWNYREWGGAQIYFMSLMKEAKRSYRVVALIPSDSEAKIFNYLESLKVPIEPVASAPASSGANDLFAKLARKFFLWRAERKLVNNILSRDGLADTVIHIDLGFWQSFIALYRLCRKTNVFVTVHTALPSYRGWRYLRWAFKGKILSRFATFHVLASNREAKMSLTPYLSADKFAGVEVTYSGIDPDEITNVTKRLPPKSDILKRYSLTDDKPIIITVGQFIERKGCWVLLESLAQMNTAGVEFRFVWLGTTLPDTKTKKRIEDPGLGDSFRLMGSEEIGETREDLLRLLSSADLFVLASLQEGLPIALIEAMALGLPCVATSVNAIPEAIEDDRNGVLVPPNDPAALREAITQLLNDEQKGELIGEAARKTAFEKFNSNITAKRTVELYDQVWKTGG